MPGCPGALKISRGSFHEQEIVPRCRPRASGYDARPVQCHCAGAGYQASSGTTVNRRDLRLNTGVALFVVMLLSGTDGSAQRPKGEGPSEKSRRTVPLIESIQGAALYKAYCATCHGIDGKGIGPMTKWLKIKPPNLTRVSLREGGTFPFARVQKIISGQENIAAGHGSREMPVWGPIFSQVASDQDWGRMRVYNLAQFIETIQEK